MYMRRLGQKPTRATKFRFWFYHCFIFSRKFPLIWYQFERILTIFTGIKNLSKYMELLHIFRVSPRPGSSSAERNITYL